MHSDTIRPIQQEQHPGPSLTDADFLMCPQKVGIISALAKGLEWTSSLVTERGIDAAIISPQGRKAYESTRICSLSFLPPEFRSEATRLSHEYLSKHLIKRAVKLASHHNLKCDLKNATHNATHDDTVLQDIRTISFNAVSRRTYHYTFRLISKDTIIESLGKGPLSPILSNFLGEHCHHKAALLGGITGTHYFENDIHLGPSIRELTEKIVTLTANGIIFADAIKSLGMTLSGSEMLSFCKQHQDMWHFFETRYWRNMVALTEHIQILLPGIDDHELGSFVSTFYKSKYPVEEFTHYQERLKVKIDSRRKLQNSPQKEKTREINTSLSSESESLLSHGIQTAIEHQLTSCNPFGLSQQEIAKYARNLSKLTLRLRMQDATSVLELLEQGYHPESVSRELRSQLRPRSAHSENNEDRVTTAKCDTLSTTITTPTPYISHYCDEHGYDCIDDWMKNHPKEITTLVQEKLDLIRQGARSKSVSSIRHDKTFGLQECRILCPNAALRVYFLPKHRETGEIKVLLIGDKREQLTDIDEAMKRAARVTAKAR